ncbi:MAG: hypothetical protein AAGU27_27690 [Dehalobacterium sp.]
MSKVFVALNEEEQLKLESICTDKDPEEALEFVLKVIVPRLKKTVPCMSGKLVGYE